ncbi:TIGR04283 family arsenosugar biosynthesis glycosyltransferase [Neptunomonas antarctica]|uniref:Transferase 2, rSAM/selenodomain-associated n=1 Tax=Neptunomonas antarctica TaxID=619304 RepID=A0A1N7M5T7_9GAMM|nr:TIGR04283 family arsenosugar biosynthesis glycosyltransferase [Neptunomonas antarctica]SIS81427.1 transferase 2, rSAM/selenodomain-associated [Neptunomonas antarctica]
MNNPLISIVIPMLNESEIIVSKLKALQPLRRHCELIVVDGGSQDNSQSLASPWVDYVLEAPAGRARQMNAGAAIAIADLLLFLHIDTELPDNLLELLPVVDNANGKSTNDKRSNGHNREYWGRFDVVITGNHWMLPCIAFFMNKRSRITGIATGDQAMFISRKLFAGVGGFPDQPLMEDIALSTQLLKFFRPHCLASTATTSGRRWEQKGVFRTICLMWSLRLAYWLGAPPSTLAKRYGYPVEGAS